MVELELALYKFVTLATAAPFRYQIYWIRLIFTHPHFGPMESTLPMLQTINRAL